MLPKLSAPRVGEVVKDDEVADASPFDHGESVEVVARRVRARHIAREQVQQSSQSRLDEMDACRLQRLHESCGKPQRNAIMRPESLSPAAREPNLPGIGDGRSIEFGEQD